MQKVKNSIDEATQNNIDSWLQGSYDEKTKEEIRKLQRDSPQELIDSFYTRLAFGTGGLRGIMGVGTNRINIYNIRTATQGLANYIKKQKKEVRQSVLIGFDCRLHSQEFAEEAAKVLAGNDIEVFLFRELRPVALISFGVLYKKCIAGIMITASHNPPAYNGYKVYWSHGGQVIPPHDKGIIDEVNQISELKQINSASFPHPLIHLIDDEIDKAYLQVIRNYQFHPGDNHTHGKELHIIYTNLHGGGITMVPKALAEWGFSNLTFVEEQMFPDGNFPTVKSPNPEEPEALKMGVDKMLHLNGDLLIGTDPDVDRLAIVVMHHGKPVFLNGNQTACIALEHICRSLKANKQFPPKAMFVKTIVTTELFRAIAEHYQAQCLDVLTGFKYIGEKIAACEEEQKANVPSHHFIFGGEESYGYLLGTHARDKDAVVSSCLIAEAALHQKLQGKTLVDFLYDIYQHYGVYRETLVSLTFGGKEGAERMHQMMENLRKNPPQMIGNTTVSIVEDYLNRHSIFPSSGKKEPLLLPKSDVLRFWLEDRTKIVIRPSGTEPKIKIYCACFKKHFFQKREEIEDTIQECDQKLKEYITILEKILGIVD